MSPILPPQLFPASVPLPLWLPLAALLAVALDRAFGEPARWHPLVGFGRLAQALERRANRGGTTPPWRGRLAGILAWGLLILPAVVLAVVATPANRLGWAAHALLLYFALGGRALAEHAGRVAADLAAGNLAAAREHVGWMVSRDTRALDASGVARACVESTLENGNDAVFGALFWFALLGGPGALLYRLANTLDAMWGYRNERYRHFGWAAARLDDALNYLPARLTALTYALCGRTRRALACWRAQAPAWDSPNAGPVMAAGAGSLGVALGGAARYHGRVEARPALGEGPPAAAVDIVRAVRLVRRSLALWLTLLCLVGVARA